MRLNKNIYKVGIYWSMWLLENRFCKFNCNLLPVGVKATKQWIVRNNERKKLKSKPKHLSKVQPKVNVLPFASAKHKLTPKTFELCNASCVTKEVFLPHDLLWHWWITVLLFGSNSQVFMIREAGNTHIPETPLVSKQLKYNKNKTAGYIQLEDGIHSSLGQYFISMNVKL